MIGKTLGKYRILEQIGRGGMASVYRAYHPGLDRYVAVKLMHSFLAHEEGFLERFRREAQSVARLRHPNIVQIFDFDAEGETYYMVMEYLEGPSLKQGLAELIEQDSWLSLDKSARIIRDVGEALDYAHSYDMIHRDVKPANIMLTADGGAILTDFGIVKMLSGSTHLTASGALIGTPAYMSPEQGYGAVGDERADIYSLGIVLYQMATGRLPYDADTPMAILLKHMNDPLPIPSSLKPDLPEGVERVILKALAKDPDDRYQSVRQMLTDLDRAMAGGTIPAVDPSITVASQILHGSPTVRSGGSGQSATEYAPPAPSPIQRFPVWVWGLLGGVAILAILLGAFVLFRGDEKVDPTPAPTESGAIAIVASPTGHTPIASPTHTRSPQPTGTTNVTATYERQLILSLIAPTATPTQTPTPSATPTRTNTPTPTDTPPATNTPDLTATRLAACVFDAVLEQHLNVFPGTYLAPSAPFVKGWRLANSGDCPWPPGSVLVLTSGNQMGAQDEIEIESVAPGATVDVSVSMVAPAGNGSYAAIWQLNDPDGEPFGEELPVAINVGPTPTPRPTNTPLPTSTPLATATPPRPLGMSTPSIRGNSCSLDPNTGTWGAILEWSVWGGVGNYEYYLGDIKPEFKLDGPSYLFTTQVGRDWPPNTFIVVSGSEEARVTRSVQPWECGY